jgi:D-aspartate ligase
VNRRTTAGVDTSTPAVILKLAHPSAALGAARTLGRMGVRVLGIDARTRGAVSTSRYIERVWRWDLAAEPASESVRFLRTHAETLERRPLLIPTDDHGALFVARHANELAESFLFPDQPPGLPERVGNKASLYHLAKEIGIPTPEVVFPRTRQDVERFAETALFPVVLKPIDSGRTDRAKITIPRAPEELLEDYDRLEDPENPNLMIQEFIPGGIDSIWMFNGYFDREGCCAVGFTGRKLRQRPPYTGMTSLGVCVANDEVDALSRRWLSQAGYRGVVDMGYRYDARDGLYKVLDVNPRVGATFRLFTSPEGMDVVRALYLDLTGQPVSDARALEGRKWIVEPFDIASSLVYWRDGNLKVREWARSLRGVEEAAWFAADDPKPFAAMCGRYASLLPRRLSGRAV